MKIKLTALLAVLLVAIILISIGMPGEDITPGLPDEFGLGISPPTSDDEVLPEYQASIEHNANAETQTLSQNTPADLEITPPSEENDVLSDQIQSDTLKEELDAMNEYNIDQ